MEEEIGGCILLYLFAVGVLVKNMSPDLRAVFGHFHHCRQVYFFIFKMGMSSFPPRIVQLSLINPNIVNPQ